jgi:dolichol-phosphate mannosyltransferase
LNSQACTLSILIPALNEADNLAELLPNLQAAVSPLAVPFEIVIIDEQANANTRAVAQRHGARVLCPPTRGYGRALVAGFEQAQGDYLLTMDADQSHSPDFVRDLWAARDTAQVVIASRYVRGGRAEMPADRLMLSRVLNLAFSRGLALQVSDMSSGFRLYHRRAVRPADLLAQDFDLLQELLVRALMEGYVVREIPFAYQPRRHGSTRARMLQFGLAYLRTFRRLWYLRNSIASADYDSRAHDSAIPPQRYWQRRRYRHISDLVRGQGPCLDVGCGSSRIIAALPPGSVALDILLRKLRFARRFGPRLIQGSAFNLPVPAASFPCVVCSQVIEHIPRGPALDELDRVLQPGGRLVLGTPDYGHWQWRVIERLYDLLVPHGYADEHITHYTRAELLDEFVTRRGYRLEAEHYILQGELILALRKPEP